MICAAAVFSSTCATDDVPGIGSITGDRRSSQARASWAGVAPWRVAMASRGPPGRASSPVAMGNHGMKAMFSRSA
ncbi:Uncharacterised protein [Mycobacteroides abscessus subsp. abscessus]|nr:Uncharacterised protein [Mycobacteroides abscessus subsp. abscessus]